MTKAVGETGRHNNYTRDIDRDIRKVTETYRHRHIYIRTDRQTDTHIHTDRQTDRIGAGTENDTYIGTENETQGERRTNTE